MHIQNVVLWELTQYISCWCRSLRDLNVSVLGNKMDEVGNTNKDCDNEDDYGKVSDKDYDDVRIIMTML